MTVGSQKKPPLGLSAPGDRLEDTAMRTVLEQTGAAIFPSPGSCFVRSSTTLRLRTRSGAP